MTLNDNIADNIDKYSYSDLLDVNLLQKIQDTASMALGIGMVITTPDGTPITRTSNFCTFCASVVRGSEKGIANCMHSDACLGRPNKDGPLVGRCLSAGLIDAGASIMIGDRHIANWLMGQVQDADNILTDEQNIAKAIELGIDPEKYLEAIKEVPAISMERFKKIAELVFLIATNISELSYRNFIQKEELDARRELERQMIHNNTHDQLTNLYNRTYYEAEVSRLDDNGCYPMSVIVGDANHLKLSNDIFGHQEGDCLLQTISAILLAEAKPEYIVARCGGDEFYILMPGVTYTEAAEYCNRIRQRCTFDYCTALPPSIALGMASRVSPDTSLLTCIKQAEDKMYYDKHQMKDSNTVMDMIRNIIYKTGYITETEHRRTKDMALAFADYLKLDDTTVANVEQLADMQYMGFVVVPKEKLAKTDRFLDFDFERQYDVIEKEYRLAKMFDKSLAIARTISQRHERWDGHGSPNRISGDAIEYLSRFIATVNAYVILSGSKPHGYAFDSKTAFELLRGEAGNSLDPVMVEKFSSFIMEYEPEAEKLK